MVNNYKRKTEQASWDEKTMARAMQEVREKRGSEKSISKKYNIPLTTLRRHVKKGSATKKLGRFKTVFTYQQEEELLEYVFHMDNLFFGLSKDDFLQLVCQYADQNNIPHPFKGGAAGHDFYKGFIARHPELTLRRPEPTSIARARGFNKHQVYRFFDLLETEIEKHQIDATRLYNMDESGIQTSSNKPPRILTKTGKKQVGLIASAERGRTTTIICCCNAAGSFVPPLMIFARKRQAPHLLDGAPPGTQAAVSDNGWTNGPIFLEWLRLFIDTVRPTADKKVLLVLDNHESHKYLPALELASKHHVIFLSLAPHTTHRMQPLDYCVYGPLKTYFEQALAVFQKSHVGRVVNQKDIAGLFCTAYIRAASTQNAVSGFEKTGLWPPNRFIFQDSDFLPATTMENPPGTEGVTRSGSQELHDPTLALEEDPSRTPSPSILEQIMSNQPITDQTASIAAFADSRSQEVIEPALNERSITPVLLGELTANSERSDTPINVESRVSPVVVDSSLVREANNTSSMTDDKIHGPSKAHKSPMIIRPVPKMVPNKTTQRRKAQRAEILTSTPVKDQQREKMTKKRKVNADKVKTVKTNLKQSLSQNPSSSGSKIKPKNVKTKTSRGKKSSVGATNENCFCIFCQEPYEHPPREDWIRCDDCQLWAHEFCTSYSGIGAYFCDNCQEI